MSASDQQQPVTAAAIKEALLHKYQMPEWHTETEITLGARRLDVVALNMWAARGWRTLGFEIKVKRNDWLGELANFDKASEWAQVVDAFYIVAPKGIVVTSEVPRGWGFLEYVGTRFFQRAAPASKLGNVWPREVVARFMQRIHGKVDALQKVIDNKERAASYEIRRELRKEIEASVKAEYEREHPELEILRRKAKAYDDIAGPLGFGRDYFGEDKLRALAKLVTSRSLDSILTGLITRATHHRDDVSLAIEQLVAYQTTFNAPRTDAQNHQAKEPR